MAQPADTDLLNKRKLLSIADTIHDFCKSRCGTPLNDITTLYSDHIHSLSPDAQGLLRDSSVASIEPNTLKWLYEHDSSQKFNHETYSEYALTSTPDASSHYARLITEGKSFKTEEYQRQLHSFIRKFFGTEIALHIDCQQPPMIMKYDNSIKACLSITSVWDEASKGDGEQLTNVDTFDHLLDETNGLFGFNDLSIKTGNLNLNNIQVLDGSVDYKPYNMSVLQLCKYLNSKEITHLKNTKTTQEHNIILEKLFNGVDAATFKMLIHDLKRSQDYGQVMFCKAYGNRDGNVKPVVFTYDLLCFTKCILEDCPVIFQHRIDPFITYYMYKPFTSGADASLLLTSKLQTLQNVLAAFNQSYDESLFAKLASSFKSMFTVVKSFMWPSQQYQKLKWQANTVTNNDYNSIINKITSDLQYWKKIKPDLILDRDFMQSLNNKFLNFAVDFHIADTLECLKLLKDKMHNQDVQWTDIQPLVDSIMNRFSVAKNLKVDGNLSMADYRMMFKVPVDYNIAVLHKEYITVTDVFKQYNIQTYLSTYTHTYEDLLKQISIYVSDDTFKSIVPPAITTYKYRDLFETCKSMLKADLLKTLDSSAQVAYRPKRAASFNATYHEVIEDFSLERHQEIIDKAIRLANSMLLTLNETNTSKVPDYEAIFGNIVSNVSDEVLKQFKSNPIQKVFNQVLEGTVPNRRVGKASLIQALNSAITNLNSDAGKKAASSFIKSFNHKAALRKLLNQIDDLHKPRVLPSIIQYYHRNIFINYISNLNEHLAKFDVARLGDASRVNKMRDQLYSIKANVHDFFKHSTGHLGGVARQCRYSNVDVLKLQAVSFKEQSKKELVSRSHSMLDDPIITPMDIDVDTLATDANEQHLKKIAESMLEKTVLYCILWQSWLAKTNRELHQIEHDVGDVCEYLELELVEEFTKSNQDKQCSVEEVLESMTYADMKALLAETDGEIETTVQANEDIAKKFFNNMLDVLDIYVNSFNTDPMTGVEGAKGGMCRRRQLVKSSKCRRITLLKN